MGGEAGGGRSSAGHGAAVRGRARGLARAVAPVASLSDLVAAVDAGADSDGFQLRGDDQGALHGGQRLGAGGKLG